MNNIPKVSINSNKNQVHKKAAPNNKNNDDKVIKDINEMVDAKKAPPSDFETIRKDSQKHRDGITAHKDYEQPTSVHMNYNTAHTDRDTAHTDGSVGNFYDCHEDFSNHNDYNKEQEPHIDIPAYHRDSHPQDDKFEHAKVLQNMLNNIKEQIKTENDPGSRAIASKFQ